MEEMYMYDGWLEDEDSSYTDEQGIPFWVREEQEDELRAWENERDEED
jgi:hypothetical protein